MIWTMVRLSDFCQIIATVGHFFVNEIDYGVSIEFSDDIARHTSLRDEVDLLVTSQYRYIHLVMGLQDKFWLEGFERFRTK